MDFCVQCLLSCTCVCCDIHILYCTVIVQRRRKDGRDTGLIVTENWRLFNWRKVCIFFLLYTVHSKAPYRTYFPRCTCSRATLSAHFFHFLKWFFLWHNTFLIIYIKSDSKMKIYLFILISFQKLSIIFIKVRKGKLANSFDERQRQKRYTCGSSVDYKQ